MPTPKDSSTKAILPERPALEPLKIGGDEILIFGLPKLDSARRPAVTLSKSPINGRLFLHFRVYRRDGNAKYDHFFATQQGCSLSLAEFNTVVSRVKELAGVLPELNHDSGNSDDR